MGDPRQEANAVPPAADDEGVRVLQKQAAGGLSFRTRVLLGGGFVLTVAVCWALWGPATATHSPPPLTPLAATTPGASPSAADAGIEAAPAPPAAIEFNALRELPPPQGDPDDLARYFREGDAVPDTATLIKAINEAGLRTGIAAFNPPGTSPPLEGLAVPADFELPPGYVRHHQVTDEGEIIEAILMFAPDVVLRDAQGQPIALPESLVVPPELAPPGLPIRWVRPGTP